MNNMRPIWSTEPQEHSKLVKLDWFDLVCVSVSNHFAHSKSSPSWVKTSLKICAQFPLMWVFFALFCVFFHAGRQCTDKHYIGLWRWPCTDLLQCERHWGWHQTHLQSCGDLPGDCNWGEQPGIRNCNSVPACDKWATAVFEACTQTYRCILQQIIMKPFNFHDFILINFPEQDRISSEHTYTHTLRRFLLVFASWCVCVCVCAPGQASSSPSISQLL